MVVRVEQHGNIAVVTIDNPPVNALGRVVRIALLEAAARLAADQGVAAVLLAGAGRVFVGGADITEFDRPVEEPSLPAVIAAIEAAAKPWIAAVQGAALGGGLELALGCHYRVAGPGATFALPEVSLGIIPGAGGTQRLPRLIGVAAAIPVVAEQQVLMAARAGALGLVDAVLTGDFTAEAIAFAEAAAQRPRPPASADRPVAPPDAGVWAAAEARVLARAKGAAAPPLALEALRLGVAQGFAAGAEWERATFLRLRAGPEAAALRYLFFAERAAPRPPDLRGVDPQPVIRAGVVGGGTMGVGIAAALRQAGLPVVLVERDADNLARGLQALTALFDSAARGGRITASEAAALRAGVQPAVGCAALAGCDLVIEAVFEDLAVKRAVFADLARVCRPDAILATNTSYLDPARIADGLPGPERFLGLHFFSPAHVMKLLEIVPIPQTGAAARAAAFALARRLGKVPVEAGICDGFIGNRIMLRYRAEAEALLRAGVAADRIDSALRDFGFAMGPFEMQDLAGLDIAFLRREAARAAGDPVPEGPGDILVRAGRRGQKTGGGWYDYRPGDRTPHLSADAARLLAPLLGPAMDMPPETIVQRLLAVMAAEGQAILAEGIAARASDIDLVLVHGYGFPRRRGGPMFMVAQPGSLGTNGRCPADSVTGAAPI